MNRKTKLPVVRVAERKEEARVAELPWRRRSPWRMLAGAIREGLLAFCCSAGLLAVSQIMNEELTVKVGPKGRHNPDRVATRNGRRRARSCWAGGRCRCAGPGSHRRR